MQTQTSLTTKSTENTKVAIREYPILFSGAMVRAILDGRKTQTRRVLNPQPKYCGVFGCSDNWIWKRHHTQLDSLLRLMGCESPYGLPGHRLWVKETFYDSRRESKRMPWTYRASISIDEDLSRDFHWKPAIFMPRIASRITLEITRVRVERLQEISEDDAQAEGIQVPEVNFPQPADSHFKLGDKLGLYVDHYRVLWDLINGEKYPWESNPWVWVVEFKQLASGGTP